MPSTWLAADSVLSAEVGSVVDRTSKMR